VQEGTEEQSVDARRNPKSGGSLSGCGPCNTAPANCVTAREGLTPATVPSMGFQAFSSHRMNAWRYSHPAAWGAIMGTTFFIASFLTNVALGSNDHASFVSGLISGAVVGAVVFLATRWKRNRIRSRD
jgi:hypothetical protein